MQATPDLESLLTSMNQDSISRLTLANTIIVLFLHLSELK